MITADHSITAGERQAVIAEITGNEIKLSGGRSVFVGRKDGDSDEYYIQFKNGPARRRFRISGEAACALLSLLADDGSVGEPLRFPAESDGLQWRWQTVRETDA